LVLPKGRVQVLAKVQMDIEAFEGIVEMDETYFLYSEKGSRHIQGRTSGIFAKLFHSSQIEFEKERFINQYLAKNLADCLQKALTEYI